MPLALPSESPEVLAIVPLAEPKQSPSDNGQPADAPVATAPVLTPVLPALPVSTLIPLARPPHAVAAKSTSACANPADLLRGNQDP
jgi:hypothetical protein